MRYTLTLSEDHFVQLQQLVLCKDKKERPAIMLCGLSTIQQDPWDGGGEIRFLSKEIIPVPDDQIIHHSEGHVTWDTAFFRSAIKRAKELNLQVCLVHSHPKGVNHFSETDDHHEKELFDILYKRNGGSHPHLSLVLTQDGGVFGRVCSRFLNFHDISLIRIFGDHFALHYPDKFKLLPKEEFHRQQLAFGPSLIADFSKLRVAVVGCGATGSATAHLLARLGVGQLLLIDKDLVERTNLSRLYGATSSDADAGRSKAACLANFISSIGIGCRVRYIHDWVGSEACRNAIKSCDIVFGCSDDNSGRIFLNRMAYFYLLPLLDMGIVIDPAPDGNGKLQAAQSRITVVQPRNTCLLCRKIVDTQLAREEQLKRNDPDGYHRQKEEAYVIGSQNPNPAVITFTTEIACMSVNELINRMTGFKKLGTGNHIVRFFDQDTDRRQKVVPSADCPICRETEYWGRGDIEPFLDQIN